MKRNLVFLIGFIASSVNASPNFDQYRNEINRCNRTDAVCVGIQLINAIEAMSVGDSGNAGIDCRPFSFNSQTSGDIIRVRSNQGQADHGEFSWPNGQIFRRANRGQANDNEFYFPNGETFVRSNRGQADDQTIYWPNGRTLVLKNPGQANHMSILRADESYWYMRNRGQTNDGELTPPRYERFTSGDSQMLVELSGEREQLQVNGKLKVQFGDAYVVVSFDANQVTAIQECRPRIEF